MKLYGVFQSEESNKRVVLCVIDLEDNTYFSREYIGGKLTCGWGGVNPQNLDFFPAGLGWTKIDKETFENEEQLLALLEL